MFTYLPPHWMKRKQLVFVGSSIEEKMMILLPPKEK
jgi:hypothetical protein